MVVPDLGAYDGISDLRAEVMYSSVEFIHTKAKGVQSVDGGAEER